MVFAYAFTTMDAEVAFAGSIVRESIQRSCSCSLFSNGAGLGRAHNAHATTTEHNPIRQGVLSMFDPFLATIVVRIIMALVFLQSGEWMVEASGGVTAQRPVRTCKVCSRYGYSQPVFPGLGQLIAMPALMMFAIFSVLRWSVYGDRCVRHLVGGKGPMPYPIIFVLAVPYGAVPKLDLV